MNTYQSVKEGWKSRLEITVIQGYETVEQGTKRNRRSVDDLPGFNLRFASEVMLSSALERGDVEIK